MAKVHGVDQGRNSAPPPLIGALLRKPFIAARLHIISALHEAGFTDIQPAHLAVFQHPGPDGRSPSEIARAALASKQAMNNLLKQLESAGYLSRRVSPHNRRDRVIVLTPRGHEVIQSIRHAVTQIESVWREQLGAEPYRSLRGLLEELDRVVEQNRAVMP